MNGRPLIYLDNAATTHKPTAVIEALRRFYAEDYGTVHRAVYELAAHSTENYMAVREKVRTFLQARYEEEIIFTKGTTESINLVAHAFGRHLMQPGDEIIITELEHHSNIVPWQLLAEERGLKLKYIPMAVEGELRLDVFKELLSEKTKLVSVAHMANSTGTILPLEEIIPLAHSVGAKIFVDGAQAAPHLPLNVQALGADFYAFSGHKIYGPTGVGVLYGKKELLEMMPPFLGGGDMIETVTMEKTTFQKTPLKFEAGTPAIAEVIGLGIAIDYISAIGKEAIQTWEEKLTLHATERLQKVPGLTLIGNPKKRGPILSFTIKNHHPLDLGTLLGLKGIAIRTGHLCAQPALARLGHSALARFSFAAYNTYDEINAATEALHEAALLLNPEYSY